MSLPQFDVQGSLFESLGSIAPTLFGDQDKYQLFAKKVWPVLARCREQWAECYTRDNGRPGVEPVVLLGVLIFQFHRAGARPPGRRDGQVPLGLETGAQPQTGRSGVSSDNLGVFPPAVT
jgi:hypothetical protein